MAKKVKAGYRVREDGTLEKRFTHDGKRYSVYGQTVKECENKMLEKIKQIEAGAYRANSAVTLDEYFAEWIEQKTNKVRAATIYQNENWYKNRIQPYLGSEKVKKIERRQIMAMQAQLFKKYKSATVNGTLRLLYGILQTAVQDGILMKNPAENIPNVKDETETAARDTIHRALTKEETAAFLKYAEGHTWYYEFFAFLFNTGMRSGEAAALKVRDLDYKAGVIHVRETVTRDRSGHFAEGPCKTKNSVRDIPMTEPVKDILERAKAKRALLAFSYGREKVRPMNEHVFVNTSGTAIGHMNVDQIIKQVLARMERDGQHIDTFTAHATRDTFATRAIENGMQPNTLKEILGHNSFSMTMDLYAHVMPNTKQDEMKLIQVL